MLSFSGTESCALFCTLFSSVPRVLLVSKTNHEMVLQAAVKNGEKTAKSCAPFDTPLSKGGAVPEVQQPPPTL